MPHTCSIYMCSVHTHTHSKMRIFMYMHVCVLYVYTENDCLKRTTAHRLRTFMYICMLCACVLWRVCVCTVRSSSTRFCLLLAAASASCWGRCANTFVHTHTHTRTPIRAQHPKKTTSARADADDDRRRASIETNEQNTTIHLGLRKRRTLRLAQPTQFLGNLFRGHIKHTHAASGRAGIPMRIIHSTQHIRMRTHRIHRHTHTDTRAYKHTYAHNTACVVHI